MARAQSTETTETGVGTNPTQAADLPPVPPLPSPGGVRQAWDADKGELIDLPTNVDIAGMG